MSIIYKRLLFVVVPVAALVLLVSSVLVGTFAWFTTEDSATSNPVTIGTVYIDYGPSGGVFDLNVPGVTSGFGKLEIVNKSNIPIAFRAVMTLTYYDAVSGKEVIGPGTQGITIGVDSASASEGWYAFKDPTYGLWVLALGNKADGSYTKIDANAAIPPVTFTVSGKDGSYILRTMAFLQAIQYSAAGDWPIQ